MKISRCCSVGLFVTGVVAGASEVPEDRGLLATTSVVAGARGLIDSTSDEWCYTISVEVGGDGHQTHEGTFYQVSGTDPTGRKKYESSGGYVLHFIEGDELEDGSFSTSTLAHSDDHEPLDEDDDLGRRLRALQTVCGHWAIGQRTKEDVAMFPMLLVEECAFEPNKIDSDSVWFSQACQDTTVCPPEDLEGLVTVTCGGGALSAASVVTSSDKITTTPAPATDGSSTPSPAGDDSSPTASPAPTSTSETTAPAADVATAVDDSGTGTTVVTWGVTAGLFISTLAIWGQQLVAA